LRNGLVSAPEILVVEFLLGGRLKRRDVASLRVDAGHYVLDGAVLAGCIHGLKNDQQRPAVLGIELFLELGEQVATMLQNLPGFFLVFHPAGVGRVVVLEPKASAFADV